MRPLPITRQLQVDLHIFNTGVERARAEYDPEPTRATYEHGNPVKPTPRVLHPDHVKADAVAAYLEGRESQRAIADRLGVQQQTVSGWVKDARENNEETA